MTGQFIVKHGQYWINVIIMNYGILKDKGYDFI